VRGTHKSPPHGLQDGSKQAGKKRAEAKNENTPAADNAANRCSESPTNTRHFDVEYPQKSPQSRISENFRGDEKRCKSLNLFGGRGRNRIISQTYFQQHAGQRMTPKTSISSLNPINRAQMERVFAASAL
jgi:hypothetical protein